MRLRAAGVRLFAGIVFLAIHAAGTTQSGSFAAFDQQGEDVIPQAFRGSWASTQADCRDVDQTSVLTVTATRISGYGFSAKLLKHAGSHSRAAMSGRDANYVTMIVARSGEGRVNLGRLKLGLVQGKLFVEEPTDPLDKPAGKSPINDSAAGFMRCR